MDLRKNLALKLAALAIAFGLWVWVAGQADVLKTVRVPLDLTGLPAGLKIVGDTPDDITVRLRGPEIALRTLPSERVRIFVNLGSVPLLPGVNRVPISTSQVHVPAGIEIDRVTPNVIELNVQRVAAREVPVRPDVRGRPRPGFEVGTTSVEPATVVIEGPESVVRTVDALSTPTVPVDGMSADLTLRVKPIATGAAAPQIQLSDPEATVEVTVQIRPAQFTRSVSGVRLVAKGETLPRNLFRPSTVTVQIAGPPQEVDRLTAADLVALVDLTTLPPSARDLSASQVEVRLADPVKTLGPAVQFRVVPAGPIRIVGGRTQPRR